MSNTNTKPAELEVVDEALVAPELEPQLPETETEAEVPAPKKKCVACRIFSAILSAICVAIIFLPIKIMKGYTATSASLLNAIKDLFGKGSTLKLFGALPSYSVANDTVSLLTGIVFYVFLLAIVLTLVLGIINIFAGKAGLLRFTAYCAGFGFSAYAICTYGVTTYSGAKGVLDLVCLGVALASTVLYIVLACAKVGKKAFGNVVQFLFTAVFSATLVLTLAKYNADFATGVKALKIAKLTLKIVGLIVFAFVSLNLLVASIRVQAKKGLVLDLIRYILQVLFGAIVCYLAIASKAKGKTFLLLAIVAVAVSIVQIIICCAQKGGKKKQAPAVIEEPEEETIEYTVEEYAEAVTYEGGPVDGVEVAEEVTPTFTEEAEPLPVQPAGYDFYNTKSFDPFIATLDNDERAQFTELFILKFKGVMPEIPDYVVGGDNKEFFRKIFIYLGQYRDRIPNNLLAKIYQFAIKF